METLRIPTFTRGERMAKAREDAGITQEEMAYLFGVSHSTIAKWEGNKAQPRDLMEVLGHWSAITLVPVPWLLDIEWAARDSNPEPADSWSELPFAPFRCELIAA